MYLVDFGWTAAKLGRPLVQFALGSDVLDLQPAPIVPSRKALHAPTYDGAPLKRLSVPTPSYATRSRSAARSRRTFRGLE